MQLHTVGFEEVRWQWQGWNCSQKVQCTCTALVCGL